MKQSGVVWSKPQAHAPRGQKWAAESFFKKKIIIFLSSLSELSFSEVESEQFLCLTWSFPKEVPVNFVRWAVFVPMLCFFFILMMEVNVTGAEFLF